MLLPTVRDSLVTDCTDAVEACIFSLPRRILAQQSREEWLSDGWMLATEIAATWRPEGKVPLDRFLKLYLQDRLFRLAATHARHDEQFQPIEPELLRDVPDPRPTSDNFLGSSWDDPDFAAARQHLSWRHRLVLALRHFEGYSQTQIAETFNVQERMVRYLLTECYETLSRHMENSDA